MSSCEQSLAVFTSAEKYIANLFILINRATSTPHGSFDIPLDGGGLIRAVTRAAGTWGRG